MANDERARGAATLIWDAWTTGRRLQALPEAVRPRDDAEAMATQWALGERAGRAFGWKVAATSEASQAYLGVPAPLAGAMYEQFRYADGATLSLSGQGMRVAEPEFAFLLGEDVREDAPAMTQVLSAVEAMHLAIEVPDSRYADFREVDGPQIIADGACTGAFVLGPAVESWGSFDLAAQHVALAVNGVRVTEGSGGQVLGDPRNSLHWLARALPAYGRQLRAGDIVTTGTAAPPAAIAPGDVVTAEFADLGKMTARFTD